MEKALRQFLVFFILLSFVALSVLVVQVFILGERVDPESELPSIIASVTPPEEDAPSPVGDDEDTQGETPEDDLPADNATDKPDEQADTDTAPPQEGMERVTLNMPGVGAIQIDYFTDLFEHFEQDYSDVFLFISPDGGSASLTVLVESGQTAKDAAEHFFDAAEPDSVLPVSAQNVGRTGIIGQYVQATVGEDTFEAWIIDIDGGIAAFSLKYSGEEQKVALHVLIDTMRLV